MKTFNVPAYANLEDLINLFAKIHTLNLSEFRIKKLLFFQAIPIDIFRCHQALLATDRYCMRLHSISLPYYVWEFKLNSLIESDLQHFPFCLTSIGMNHIYQKDGYEFDEIDTESFPLFTALLIKDKKRNQIIGLFLKHPSPFKLLCTIRHAILSAIPDLSFKRLLSLYNIKLSHSSLEATEKESRVSHPPTNPSINYIKDLDSISLCIITNGKNDSTISDTINHFFSFAIPNSEVLICGPYKGLLNSLHDVKILDEPQKDTEEMRGWITKKKNILALAAKNKFLLIFHERFSNLGRIHNEFNSSQVLVFPTFRNNKLDCRINDWEEMIGSLTQPESLKLIPMGYSEKGEKPLVYGAAFGINKSLFLKLPLNDILFWSEAEDLFFSEILNIFDIKPVLSTSPLISPHSRSKGMKNNNIRLLCSKFITRVYYGRIKCFIQDIKSILIYD